MNFRKNSKEESHLDPKRASRFLDFFITLAKAHHEFNAQSSKIKNQERLIKDASFMYKNLYR